MRHQSVIALLTDSWQTIALASPQLGFPCMSPARCMVHDMLSLGCSVAGAVLIMVVNSSDSDGLSLHDSGLDSSVAHYRIQRRNVLHAAMWMLTIVV